MDTTTTDLSQTLQALPPRLRAELLRHLRCADAVRAEERERYRPDPVMAAWVELLDELETGGPLMREAVRDTLEIYGERRMRTRCAGRIFADSRAGRAASPGSARPLGSRTGLARRPRWRVLPAPLHAARRR